ncbi:MULTISPECIES: type II toxin-antitoxin system VapB family antitoxin [unclassified Sphingomonas]|uniref:type II toxin-antitoxin system VapB family antitoxin n=1 Tax=unclassified Sphingomonas TaxID=196159 RepID=UPI001F5A1CA0|nr:MULTISPECIES: type II toxin-antitoxin system VapB family antitoxin [unclassified Sphingomonas]
MRTNIEIDDALMADAMKATGAKTKREAVEQALRWMVTIKRQREAIEQLRGLGWEGDLDEMRTDKRRPEWG